MEKYGEGEWIIEVSLSKLVSCALVIHCSLCGNSEMAIRVGPSIIDHNSGSYVGMKQKKHGCPYIRTKHISLKTVIANTG